MDVLRLLSLLGLVYHVSSSLPFLLPFASSLLLLLGSLITYRPQPSCLNFIVHHGGLSLVSGRGSALMIRRE